MHTAWSLQRLRVSPSCSMNSLISIDPAKPPYVEMENGVLYRIMPAKSAKRSNQNVGEEVTQAQQWRILSSTSLVAFTVIGKWEIKMSFAMAVQPSLHEEHVSSPR